MISTVTVDIGTTGIKLCLFDAAGQVLFSARHVTPTVKDASGEAYDLEVLTGHLTDFLLGLDATQRARVQRIALTGVGESGGLVRPDLSLASPMILWHDHRGAARIARLTSSERSTVYGTTGLPANANYGISKAAWAQECSGEHSGAQWLNVAEYLAALMSGQRWSEYSLASRTMALDLQHRRWSTRVCALFGLSVDTFPALRLASEGSPVSPDFAKRHGLSDDVQVHVAGHDHMVGAVGAGLGAGELLNSTGTTEGLLYLRDSPVLDPAAEQTKLANGISCGGDQYTLFASIPTGGSAFATLQSLLGLDAVRLAACVSALHGRYLAGTLDLTRTPLVLPQFRGSPPPSKDAAARGIIAGLATDTTFEEVVFGCFLGMTAQFADVLDLFGARPECIKVIGPASRNPLWLQLKADLLEIPLSVSRFPEVVSRGAQALASAQVGIWSDCDPLQVLPDSGRHEQLQAWRWGARETWDHLKSTPE